MAKLTYVAETGIWTVRGDGATVSYPITPMQAVSIDDVQFLQIVAEAETIDELSKNTLRNYTQTAVIDKGKADRDSVLAGVKGEFDEKDKHDKRSRKRFTGILKATNKLAKEEIEALFKDKLDEDALAVLTGSEETLIETKLTGGIIDQLQRASDISTKVPVKFDDGHATTVPTRVAQAAVKAYAVKKSPEGKEAIARAFSSSLASFKAAAGLKEDEDFDTLTEAQLDELSRGTLNRYVDKAAKEVNDEHADSTVEKRPLNKKLINKRDSGIVRAINKANEEQLDEISDKTKSSYYKKAHADKADHADAVDFYKHNPGPEADEHKPKHEAAHRRRVRGLVTWHRKATKELSKPHPKNEEVEEMEEVTEEEFKAIIAKVNEGVQLDEISKEKLGRYVKAASDDLRKRSYSAGKHVGNEEGSGEKRPFYQKKDPSGDTFLKRHKRTKGISTAVDKLTKEEVEPELPVIDEKVKFDDEDDTDVKDKLSNKNLKKAYDRMRRTRANDKRKFEEIVYKSNASDDAQALGTVSESFMDSLKKIAQRGSIDEERKVIDFKSRTSK